MFLLYKSVKYDIKSLIIFNIVIILITVIEAYNMELYLRECKENINKVYEKNDKTVVIVLGNEACDLDSAVSALVYAYFLKHTQYLNEVVLPVLNVKREELRLHTEVVFFLEETSINLKDVICKDEVNIQKFLSENRLKVVLVDHNVLSSEDVILQPAIVDVVDHHAIEQPEALQQCPSITIEPVGSCCTLVARKVFSIESRLMDPQIAMLLYGTILLDTVCLQESAKRVTDEDRSIVTKLENLLEGISREEVFQALQKAKFDISGLTVLQVLQKDLKIVTSDSFSVAIASIPALLEVFLKGENIEPSLETFSSDNHYNAVVMLGSQLSKDKKSVQRQIAVFSMNKESLNELCEFLKKYENSHLQMEELQTGSSNILLFDQKNSALTRKYVLPAVRSFLEGPDCVNENGCNLNANSSGSEDQDMANDILLSQDLSTDYYRVQALEFPDSPIHTSPLSLLGANDPLSNAVLGTPNCGENSINANKTPGQQSTRKIISVHPSELIFDATNDDQKSLSSLSNKSDNDVFSPAEDIVLPEDDDIDTPEELENSENFGLESSWSEPIPEMSAAEEFEEERSWKTCVVGGEERRVDMKVIDPYKKVLSHGGYHGETRNAIIIFSACYLPDRSRRDYDYVMDNLFLYVLSTLDQLVAEDYVLVYLHGATERGNMPSFGWLKRCYQMIDRRLRKNLKGLYLVHPTFWLKTIVIMTKPFISSKFSRKLKFVNSLDELSSLLPMDHICIPDKVKMLDFECMIKEKKKKMKNKKVYFEPIFIIPPKERY